MKNFFYCFTGRLRSLTSKLVRIEKCELNKIESNFKKNEFVAPLKRYQIHGKKTSNRIQSKRVPFDKKNYENHPASSHNDDIKDVQTYYYYCCSHYPVIFVSIFFSNAKKKHAFKKMCQNNAIYAAWKS